MKAVTTMFHSTIGTQALSAMTWQRLGHLVQCIRVKKVIMCCDPGQSAKGQIGTEQYFKVWEFQKWMVIEYDNCGKYNESWGICIGLMSDSK